MSLHVNTTEGPKAVSKETLRTLVEKGHIQPQAPMVSIDGGYTWISYQQLLASLQSPAGATAAPTAPPARLGRLHIRSTAGAKEISLANVERLIDQGRLQPSAKALSIDGGVTWISYQTLAAQQTSTRQAPTQRPPARPLVAPPLVAPPAQAPAQPVAAPPSPPLTPAGNLAGTLPADSPTPAAAPIPVEPIEVEILTPEQELQEALAPRPLSTMARRSAALPGPPFMDIAIYGIVMLALAILPFFAPVIAEGSTIDNIEYDYKVTWPMLSPLIGSDSAGAAAGMSGVSGGLLQEPVFISLFFLGIGIALTVTGLKATQRQSVAIAAGIGGAITMAIVFSSLESYGVFSMGTSAFWILMGITLEVLTVMVWNDDVAYTAKRAIAGAGAGCMVLGLLLPVMEMGPFSVTVWELMRGLEASGILWLWAAILATLGSAFMLMCRAINWLDIERHYLIIALSAAGVLLFILIAAGSGSGVMFYDALLVVGIASAIFGLIPLSVTHISRAAIEAQQRRLDSAA